MNNKKIITYTLMILCLFVLLNPQYIPFLDTGTKNAIANELITNFKILLPANGIGIFSLAKLFTIITVAIFVYLVVKISCFVLDKLAANKNRSKTVAGLLENIICVTGAAVAIIWILNILGVNMAAILASLGIVSLIVGFGVQSLVEDCITGIFIILEGEYNVGDIIVLEEFRGTVKKISMRTTTIEDEGGNLQIINNSDIRNIQNRSFNESVAICTVSISYDESLNELEHALEVELPIMFENNKDVFDGIPIYDGVQELAEEFFIIQIKVAVSEKNIYQATRRLNREIKLLLEKYDFDTNSDLVIIKHAD